uniref:Uncharacterized protein n=1 Tax=Zea mays TaxID=4577 RepID=C0PCT7_MAIZE|nr:unknown [Zea mays]
MASSSSDGLFRFAICLGASWSSRTGDMPTKFEMNWRSSTLITAASSPSVVAETSCRGSCSILIPRGSKISTFSSGAGTAAVDDSPTAELAAATNASLCCCTASLSRINSVSYLSWNKKQQKHTDSIL